MSVNNFIPRFVKHWAIRQMPKIICATESYSQSGEDMIVNHALCLINDNRPVRYIDIGANDAFRLSNTALFYKKGGSGILIEPNPGLAKNLTFMRGDRDTILQCGVHFSDEPEADFYVMDWHVLSTFSNEEAERYIKNGRKLKNKIKVPLKSINEILDIAGPVDFLSIDVEGLDEAILYGIDWKKHRPTCICAETITYETEAQPKKLHNLLKYMIDQGYMIFADTYLNTIFVEKSKWDARFNNKKD
jgi:FkbM family methyltransferase